MSKNSQPKEIADWRLTTKAIAGHKNLASEYRLWKAAENARKKGAVVPATSNQGTSKNAVVPKKGGIRRDRSRLNKSRRRNTKSIKSRRTYKK
jgi:hypothetical protein